MKHVDKSAALKGRPSITVKDFYHSDLYYNNYFYLIFFCGAVCQTQGTALPSDRFGLSLCGLDLLWRGLEGIPL